MELTFRSILLFSVALANLGLGSYFLWRYRRRKLTRVLGLLVLFVGAFGWLTAGMAGAQSHSFAVSWIRSFGIGLLVTPAFFHFACVFSRQKERFVRWVVPWAYGYFILWVLLRGTGIVPIILEQKPGQGWFPVDAAYFAAYVSAVLILWIWGLGMIIQRRRASQLRLERTQIDFFFLVLAITVGTSFFNLTNKFSFVGAFAPLVFSGGLSYGILKKRLFDLSVVIRRGVVSAAMAMTVAVAFVLLLLATEKLWVGDTDYPRFFSAFILALLLGLIFQPLKRSLDSLVDYLFGLTSFSPNERLLEYLLLASRFTEFEDYLHALTDKLQKEMSLEQTVVYMRTSDGDFKVLAQVPFGNVKGKVWPPLSEGDSLLSVVRNYSRGFDYEDLLGDEGLEKKQGWNSADQGRRLQAWGVQAVFSIYVGERLEGLLFSGEKQSGQSYKEEEYQFLSALGVQVGTVMQNSMLARQVQHADRLATLGTMSAGVAHEIRNPLTAISNFVQMLPQRVGDERFMEKFMRIVSREITRLTDLTENLLKFSKPEKSERHVVDVADLCTRVEALLSYQFSKKNVILRMEVEALENILTMVNETQVSQILINLLLNALQASEADGEVLIKGKPAENGKTIFVWISDKGKGMSSAQLRQIFDPFFTTKINGTGLGLSTCQRLAVENGASLKAQSTEGVGTTFELVFQRTVKEQIIAA